MKILARREFPAFAALLLLLLSLAFGAKGFYSAENLRDVALANVPVLLVAAGMTLIVVARQIDISVGSMFALCAVLCGFAAKRGTPEILLLPLAIFLGALLGALNGWLVAKLGAPSIVATLASMIVWRESLRWITGGAWIEDLPGDFQWFGLGQASGQLVILFAAALVFAACWWLSENVLAFRWIYAVGSNAESARLAGIDPLRVTFSVFVLIGALTGLGSFLNAARFSDVPANSGIGLELKAIAAVVVGGTPITGGSGSPLGTLLGVVLLGLIGPALTFLGINPYWEKAFQGGIILAATLFDVVFARIRARMVPA